MSADRWRTPLIPVAAAVGLCCGVTVLLLTIFNYFVAPMGRDLGLTSAEVSGALSFHILALIVALPLAGALCDRLGPRRVICSSAVAFGLALYAISRVGADKGQLYLAFALAGAAGAGTAPITYARSIVGRFDRRRGLALGVALSGVGFASILLPPVVRATVEADGWRAGFVTIAGLAAAAGLLGGALADGRPSRTAAADHDGLSVREAARRWGFWGIALAFALLGVALPGVMTHVSEAFRDRGWPADRVPLLQSALGAATIAGRIGGGALMDRFAANRVGAAAAVCGGLGLAALALSGGQAPLLILAGALLGLCLGAESDVTSYLASRYFGLRRFSAIYALLTSCFMVGAAAGPYLMARVAESAGFTTVFLGAAAGLALSAMLLASLPRPHRL